MSTLFNSENIGQEFISIKCQNAAEILEDLKIALPIDLFNNTKNEIILNIPDGGCGFSLNALKQICMAIGIFNDQKLTVEKFQLDYNGQDYIREVA